MNSRAAFWGMLVVFVALLGALFFLLRSTPAAVTSTPDRAAQGGDAAEPGESPTAVDAARDTVPEAVPERAVDTDASRETIRPRTLAPETGRGSVSGTVALGEGMRREDVTVTLVRVEERLAEVDAEAETWTQGLDGENGFRFADLPLGRYWLKGRTDHAVAASMPELTRRAPDFTVDMALVPSGTLEGRVVNSRGEAVADARVYITGTGAQFYPIPEANVQATRVTTDEDGYFLSQDHGVTQHWLKVTAEGYADQGYGPLEVDTPGAVITLHAGGGVSGVVVSSDTGRPVTGVKVQVSSEGPHVGGRAETDEEGRFQLAGLAPGDYTGLVREEKYVMPGPVRFQVKEGEETKNLRLEVFPGAVIAGRVYDEDTDAGIAGVRVMAQGLGQDTNAETRADGTYRIEGLPGGRYEVRYTPQGNDWAYGNRYEPPRVVTVASGGKTEDIDFALSKGLHLSGRVVDGAGDPVPNAGVSVQTGQSYGHNSTDADGYFTVNGLEPLMETYARASAEGYGRTKAGPFDLTDGSVEGVEIVMATEATIEGVVVDSRGQGVPKAEVMTMVSEGANQRIGYGTEADEQGAFRINQLPAGTCTLTPRPAGQQGGFSPDNGGTEIAVKTGEHVTGVRLVLDTSGSAEITGRVVDEEDQPIHYASVQAMGGPDGMQSMAGMQHGFSQTDEEGNFTLRLQEGLYQLTVSSGQYASKVLDDVATGSDVEVVLGKRGRVAGTVIDGRTRQPVPYFEVAVEGGLPLPNSYTRFTTFSSEDGHFELDAQGQGTTVLFARAKDYALARVDVGEVGAGEMVDNVVIALETARPLYGLVIDRGGAPVGGASILVDDAQQYMHDPSQNARAQSGTDGTFEILDLPPGPHTLKAWHPDYAMSTVAVDTLRQEEVEIVLGHGGTIAGIVTLDGVGLAGANINALGMVNMGMSQPKQVQSGADGRFELSGLDAGTVIVACSVSMDGASRMKQVQAEVANEAVTEVTFAFGGATAAVEGYVRLGDGAPAQAQVQAMQPEAGMNHNSASTDADGHYRLDGLEPGAVTVVAMIQSDNAMQPIMLTAQLEVADGETVRHDFDLAEAARLVCNVSNIPADAHGASVMVMRGAVDINSLNMENYMGLMGDMAGAGMVMPGTGGTEIYGLAPGEYTVVAVAMVPTPGGDPFANAAMAAAPLTVTANRREYALDLAF